MVLSGIPVPVKVHLFVALTCYNAQYLTRCFVDGQDLISLSQSELKSVHRQIDMIFQYVNLLSSCIVFGNVALPLNLNNTTCLDIKKRIAKLLKLVGLVDKHDAYFANLSSGQK